MMNNYQEAFDVIDTILHLMCGEKREDGYEPTMEEMTKAMSDFQELVDKATPNKPNYEAYGYSESELVYDTWICPSCRTRYEVDYDSYEYCPNCGQALDWSEEE